MAAAVVGVGVGGGEAASQEPMSWPEFRALDPVEPDHRIQWGRGPHAYGELHLPSGVGPHPVAVVVHGGCWRSIAGADYMSHLARALADAGWAAWSIEFRRIDQAGGAWPGILEDVAAGADHLAVIAPEFDLDLTRVASVGHSSGGHLALWLAGRGSLPTDPPEGPRLRGDRPFRVAGVLALASIGGLEDFHARGGGGCGSSSVQDLLGVDPADAGLRLELTSPDRRLPLGVPQLLVTGVEDRTVPAAHAEAWVAAARAAGDSVRLLTPSRAGHFEVVAPWTDPFRVVWPEVQAFLGSLGASPKAPAPY